MITKDLNKTDNITLKILDVFGIHHYNNNNSQAITIT